MSQTRWSRPYCRKSWADGHQLLSLLTTTMIETDFGERFIKTNNVIIFQLTFTLYFCQITVHFFTFLCSPYLSFEHMQVEKKPHCERSCCCSDTHYKIDHRTGVPNSVPGVKPAPWTMRNNVWPLTIFDLGFIFLGVSFANVLYSGPPTTIQRSKYMFSIFDTFKHHSLCFCLCLCQLQGSFRWLMFHQCTVSCHAAASRHWRQGGCHSHGQLSPENENDFDAIHFVLVEKLKRHNDFKSIWLWHHYLSH